MKYENKFEFINDYMYLIIIKNNKEIKTLLDRKLYNKIKKTNWWINKAGYIETTPKFNKNYLLHRFITNCPKDKIVHHINQNKLDNRISNLKVMDALEHNLLHNPPKD